MTASALLSAMRIAGRQQITACTLRARPATGSHVFRIEEFTRLREKVANGIAVTSSPFVAGGHEWRIKCYPNGILEDAAGHISLYLKHDSDAKTGDAIAAHKMSILDKSWKPSCTKIDENHRFETSGICWGWKDFIKHQDLDRDKYLEDDCLSVLCEVTVDGLCADEADEVEDLKSAPRTFDLHDVPLWNGQAADLIIHLRDGQTNAAHRRVLEARSRVLKGDLALALYNAATDKLHLHVDMDDVCNALLQFVYTDSPPLQLELAPPTTVEQLLVAADRYELEKLKLACEKVMCKNIDTGSVAASLVLAGKHGCPVLREACVDFLHCPANLKAFITSDGVETFRDLVKKNIMPLHKKLPLLDTMIEVLQYRPCR